MSKGIYKTMQEHVQDWDIVDCSIRSKDCIYIFFQQAPDGYNGEVNYRAGFYYPKTERVWGYNGFGNFYKSKSCVIPNGPVIAVDFKGQVLSQTGEIQPKIKFNGETDIPLIRQVSVMRVREIGGYAYMAGTLRTVFRRENAGEWICLSGNDLAVRDEEDKQGKRFGFNDIDGFSVNEIYACGGGGDLWYYNGKTWEQQTCPTDTSLLSICCAPNGKVYVGGIKGVLLEGKNNEWKVVGKLGKCGNTWIKRMEWFQDKLYLATDQGLYEYANGEINSTPIFSNEKTTDQNSDEKSKERINKLLVAGGADCQAVDLANLPILGAPASLHSISTDGELLVLGGGDKVAVYDGTTWKTLFAPYGFDEGGSIQ